MPHTVEEQIQWLSKKSKEAADMAARYRVASDHWKLCIADMQGFAEAARMLLTYREAMGIPGILAIANERFRQIGEKGFTVEHDVRTHRTGQLAHAAVCYAGGIKWPVWPWGDDMWKPTERRQNLVKAGALLAAEIDRIDYLKDKINASQKGKVAQNRVREHPHGDQGRPATEAGGGYSTFEGWEEPEETEGC